jgi:DNA-binding NtrC family response regulator/iron only hydrogenase large subunit-like protein
VKAIKVHKDHAEIIASRCIGCGICVRACSQQAKVIADSILSVQKLITGSEPVVAILGCSYPAFFNDIRPGQLVAGLKTLGFSEVHEGSSGVELIRLSYQTEIESQKKNTATLLSSHCPAIVDLIERHYPQLLRNLIKTISPKIAAGRFIKETLGPRTKVVYISSCIAGKFEVKEEQIHDAIDVVLTYKELYQMFKLRKLDLSRLRSQPFDGTPPRNESRLFAIAGGPLSAFGIKSDIFHPEYLNVEGPENVLEIIHDVAAGRITPRFIDIRFCTGGCIGGPGKNNRLTTFSKRNLIYQHSRSEVPYQTASHYCTANQSIVINRSFRNKHKRLELPSGESVRNILQSINKFVEGDELNCGACGYATCREYAVAVFQGLAEREMCLPYAVKRLEEDHSMLTQKFELAQRALAQEVGSSAIVGNDPRTMDILGLIHQVAPTPTTVLIRGESGTGKELTARAIHEKSLRADKPLVTINCTTITDSLLESELFGHKKGAFTGAAGDKKGLFEAANGGTIFLDEIGDITPKLQAELLRVLDNGEIRPVGGNDPIKVDVRLIAATNKDLEAGIREGWFREDLYYRLNVFTISQPPLRSRLESLPDLVENFRARASRRLNKPIKGIDERALRALMRYPWPGNIRELQNIIERASVLALDSVIRLENLPVVFTELSMNEGRTETNQNTQSFRSQRDKHIGQMEKNLLIHFLRETGGNVSAAAIQAGIPRRTFYRLLKRNDLNGKEFNKNTDS